MRTGILTEDDPQAIAAELEFAASHIDEVRQMGDHAMNEVYMSWQTSVENAYRRYGEIIEEWRTGNTCNQETELQQDLSPVSAASPTQSRSSAAFPRSPRYARATAGTWQNTAPARKKEKAGIRVTPAANTIETS